ncbi:MAG: hypothetical protein ACLGG8_10670 [Gammaproteobacteria bacterium]
MVEGGAQAEEIALEELLNRWPQGKPKVLDQLKDIGLDMNF